MSSAVDSPLLSVLLPTRGRPQLARTFLDSLSATAREPGRLEVILYVDDDDGASVGIGHPQLEVTTLVGPPVTMGVANTACRLRSNGEILVLANDDVVVETTGWDQELRACHARFADGIYLAWPNDGISSWRMSTFPVLSRRCCDVLADPYPAVYRSAFIDYQLFDIFTRLRRLGHDRLVYLDRVVFDHRHHRSGKRAADDTTRRHRRFEDDMTFLAGCEIRQRQAERLAAAIESSPLPPPAMQTEQSLPRETATFGRFARTFFGDQGLPWSRRAYLFIWYCGRHVAASWQARRQQD